MYENLVKTIINDYNGTIKPLIISSDLTNGTGLCNPSLFVENDTLHCILRNVEYTLHCSEGEQKFQSFQQGHISYYHRDDKNELKTFNYYCEIDLESLEIKKEILVDTSKLDKKPIWTFIGLEDARFVIWDNKKFMIGVRRDTTTNGQGRMEFSEIEIYDEKVVEINRNRIEVSDINSYCEKNWMPILDKPYHFVKWTNPVEIVKVNLNENISETVILSDTIYDLPFDIRGGTPLVRINEDLYLCITHEVKFILENYNGHKESDYYHRFILFNNDLTINYISEQFNFMTSKVEFCIGLALHENNIFISFGFQDNCT